MDQREKTPDRKKIPVGTRFFATVQTGPWAHPASWTMGTGSFWAVKRPGRGADHPHPSSAEAANGLEIHLPLRSVPAQFIINFSIYLFVYLIMSSFAY